MLTIYHVTGTRSVRTLWLCYELALEFDLVSIDFSREYRDTPEWRSISPAGKVPALRDGELTMFESGAMQSYLLERYGQGRLQPPPGTAQSARFHQWCWFAEATLTRPIGLHRILRSGTSESAVLVAEGTRKAQDALAAVEAELQQHAYVLGSEFSAADIMLGYSLGLLESLVNGSYPACTDYLERVRARPACAQALAA